MKNRCYNKNEKCYHRYGGRGIKVCKRWKNSYWNFFLDTYSDYRKARIKYPGKVIVIDRIDNNGDYDPHNFQFITSEDNTSKDTTGSDHHMYGKKASLETRKKMSETRKRMNVRGENHPSYGKRHTEEWKKMMSERRKGKFMGKDNSRSRVVERSKDGITWERFDSGMDAHRATGINRGNIAACARGVVPKAGGYMWRYKNN